MRVQVLRHVMMAAVALASLSTAQAAAPDGPAKARDKLFDPDGGVFVVAHRGCHNPAPSRQMGQGVPENSIQALERCIALGVDMMEVDVRRSKDGVLMIMHDETVDRTTTGKGRVADLTASQIKALKLRQNFGGAMSPMASQESPSTLSEFLDQAKGRLMLNLDVKDPVDAEVVAAVRASGMQDQILIKAAAGAGTPPLADQDLYRDLIFMPIVKPSAEGQPPVDLGEVTARQALARHKIPAVEMVFLGPQDFHAVRVAARKAKIRLWTNTLTSVGVLGVVDLGGDLDALRDPDGAWGKLIDEGVTIIQTDEPAPLLDYLKVRAARTN